MNKLFNIFINIYFCFSITFLKINAKEIIIHNDDNFKNFQNIINDNQNDKNLVLKFVDNYYNMQYLGYSMSISVDTNISFIGNENKTVFDYKNDSQGRLFFTFNTNKIVNINNIIIENFTTNGIGLDGVQAFTTLSYTSNSLKFIFNNCIFRNNGSKIIHYEIKNSIIQTEPQFIFNDCDFQ